MKRIKLTQGKFAIVDDQDFEWLSQWKWHAQKDTNCWYAVRHRGIRMHREIVGLKKGVKKDIDHRDGNGLNNQRSNLRICTRSTNLQDRHFWANDNRSCKYQGVSIDQQKGKYVAYICKDYKRTKLGIFENKEEAARAYDKAALKLFGPTAKTNFPKENYNE